MSEFQHRFLRLLHEFFIARGIEHDDIDFDKRLIEGYGLTSDQGIELALIFETSLGVVFPESLNPAVNDDECRGRTISELFTLSKLYLSIKE